MTVFDPAGDRSGARGHIQRPQLFDDLTALNARFPRGAVAGKILTGDAMGVASWGDMALEHRATGDQTANLTDTFALVTPGTYLVCCYAEVTTAGAAGTLTVSLAFTSDNGAKTPTIVSAFAVTGTNDSQGTYACRIASGGLSYTFALAGILGAPHYTGYIAATRLG